MSISAMKCALQSLESVEKVNGWNKDSIVGRHCTQSAHFLRQAIEQAEDAVAAEREACAKLLENGRFLHDEAPAAILAKEAAKAIRARGDASDINQEPVDETAKDRHEWVDLTQQEVEQIYSETQDEFQFSQLLAYKLREKNSEWNGKGWA